MRAVVLAGGSGTRLRPLTPALPKPFAPVANRPILAWVLDHLDTAEFEQIGVIVPTVMRQLYEQGFGHRTAAGTPICWLSEEDPLGTGGALRAQRAFIGDDPVVVVPADILCPVDLPGTIAYHRAHRPSVTVAVTPRNLAVWDGDIVVPRGPVAGAYLFKPGSGAPSCLGSTGTWVVEPALIDEMVPTGVTDFSREVLPGLPSPAHPLGMFHTGPVYLRDVGTMDTLLAGNRDALQGSAPLCLPEALPGSGVMAQLGAVIDDGALVEGRVLLGAGARVCAGARVSGPTVVGPGARIGPWARMETALVLPGAVVPPGQRMADQVVGEGAVALQALLEYASLWGAR